MSSSGDQGEQPVLLCGGRVLGLLAEGWGPEVGEGLLEAESLSALNL